MASSVYYASPSSLQENFWASRVQFEACKLPGKQDIASMRLGAVLLVMALAVCSSAVIGEERPSSTLHSQKKCDGAEGVRLCKKAHPDRIFW